MTILAWKAPRRQKARREDADGLSLLLLLS
jgi:hypothetical protein